MTKEQLVKIGTQARRGIHKIDARLEDWGVFSKTFGFFQFKKKHNLTDEEVEFFRAGWCADE